MITLTGKNLVFIISQPSSGSTLLQLVLLNHKDIYSLPETWLLLSPLTIFNTDIIEAAYNKNIENYMLIRFWKHLNKNSPKEEYYNFIRESYTKLYNKLIRNTNKKIFIDKTPRYYLIIDEITKVFPDAKIILLLRNPIAVYVSIYNILGRERWNKNIKENYIDFVTAIDNIILAKTKNNNNIYSLKYENLLNSFDKEIRSLLKFLDLEFQEGMNKYHYEDEFKWGDNSGNITKYSSVQPRSEDDWKNKIKNTELYYQVKDYIQFLRKDKISKLGYDYDHIITVLNTIDKKKLHKVPKVKDFEQSVLGLSQYNLKSKIIENLCYYLKKII